VRPWEDGAGMSVQQLGKYEVIARIGQGAMGEVFRAHDPVIGRDVALKVMAAVIGDDDELRQRFQREARSAGRLNHPNIVTIYDFGEDQGRIFIAMELLEGQDLKDLIARQAPLSVEQKLDFMQQICAGVAFAHSKDVIHRDLKPANVHLAPSGLVKIMDFGVAKYTASDITGAGVIVGTPNYMSPEQVHGEKATARSDVFSLGALFYELLSYRKPFTGDSLHAILFQVTSARPEPLMRIAPAVPPAVGAVVERALEKDPLLRHRDADELGQSLREARAAAAPAPVARPVRRVDSSAETVVMRAVPRRRRWPLALAGGAGVLVLFSAAGLVAYRFPRAAPAAPPTTLAASPPPTTATATAAPLPEASASAPVALRPAPPPSPETVAEAARPPVERRAAQAEPLSRAGGAATGGPGPRATPRVAVPPPTPLPAARPSPSPSPSLPPAPPAPDAASAVPAIREVLSRYGSAFAALDLHALRAVHPGLDERSARQLFASVKGYKVKIEVEGIDVSGLVARAECVGTYDPVPRPAGTRTQPLRQTFELKWDGQRWLIVRVHSRR
jgi:eukaryotic-like serine/threonine-protein kinase